MRGTRALELTATGVALQRAVRQALVSVGTTLRSPADLARWPLLDLDAGVPGMHRLNWARWFEFAGVAGVEPRAGRLVFSFVDQAVIRGQGVALVRSPFLQDGVASGDLVMPVPHLPMPAGHRHVQVVNRASARRQHVEAFLDRLAGHFRRAPQLAA